MINFIKNLFKKEIRPLSLSKEELTKIFNEQQVCPDCGVWDFREGPSGGMSVNIYCANCGSWFNEQGPFGLDRIFKEENLDWRSSEKIYFEGKNYESYTWSILKDWHGVKFPFNYDIKNLADSFYWCNNDIDGSWSIKDSTMYFEKETDAMAFKLRWI